MKIKLALHRDLIKNDGSDIIEYFDMTNSTIEDAIKAAYICGNKRLISIQIQKSGNHEHLIWSVSLGYCNGINPKGSFNTEIFKLQKGYVYPSQKDGIFPVIAYYA